MSQIPILGSILKTSPTNIMFWLTVSSLIPFLSSSGILSNTNILSKFIKS